MHTITEKLIDLFVDNGFHKAPHNPDGHAPQGTIILRSIKTRKHLPAWRKQHTQSLGLHPDGHAHHTTDFTFAARPGTLLAYCSALAVRIPTGWEPVHLALGTFAERDATVRAYIAANTRRTEDYVRAHSTAPDDSEPASTAPVTHTRHHVRPDTTDPDMFAHFYPTPHPTRETHTGQHSTTPTIPTPDTPTPGTPATPQP